jgi:UrcA family protein
MGNAWVCAAADARDTVSQTVKYGDLILSNPEGAATLYRRIVAAANNVCSSNDTDLRVLTSQVNLNGCIHKATMEAVTKVGHPELTAVYNSKNRHPLPITVASAGTH